MFLLGAQDGSPCFGLFYPPASRSNVSTSNIRASKSLKRASCNKVCTRLCFKRMSRNQQPLEFFIVRCSHDFPMISGDVLMESPNFQKFPQENPDLHQAQGASTGWLHGLALTEEFFGLALFGRLTKTHSFAG